MGISMPGGFIVRPAVMGESAGKNRHGGGGESPPRGKA